jgi:hypothetical protein
MTAVLTAGAVSGVVGIIAVLLIAALAAGSIWAGWFLIRRDERGVAASLWLLSLQAVRLIIPGVAWFVTLGWSVNLVLYSGGEPEPDGLETVVTFGGHERPSYLAINLLALVPLLALALWRRSAIVAARNARAISPAPR